MDLTPAQATIALDKHRFRVLNCGRRFGKTTLAVEEIKGKVAAGKKRIAYCAPTYQQARDIIWQMLKKDFHGAYFNEQRMEVKVGEATIFIKGWESIETLRGQAFDFIVIDEVAMMKGFWTTWREVIKPCLIDTIGKALFISTPKGFNAWYDLYNEELKNPDFKSFHFTSYDNPHISKEEIDNDKRTMPLVQFEQEYMASFKKTQGLVYKEFDREKHLYDVLPDGVTYQRVAGVDFGFRNPAAVLDVYIANERYYVEDEWYKRERTDAVIADYVKQMGVDEVYPDPENAGGIEELRQRSLNVREVVKGKGSVENGIQKVKEALIAGKLMINKQCINLISEFEMYSYDDDKKERNENENPVKANDHALDALRYVVMMVEPAVDYGMSEQIESNRVNILKKRQDAGY